MVKVKYGRKAAEQKGLAQMQTLQCYSALAPIFIDSNKALEALFSVWSGVSNTCYASFDGQNHSFQMIRSQSAF